MDAQPAKTGKKKYFESELVSYLSTTGEPISSADGRMTIRVARHYGFCHGVIRAIRMALDATEKYAGRRTFLLGQIIHNPYVNEQLCNRGVSILDIPWESHLSSIEADDVVIVPAFGVSAETMQRLRGIGCTIVDTACGEVMSVWKHIGRYNAAGFTTIIHGKAGHEETIATSSRCERHIMVKDVKEAQVLAGYIRKGDPAQGQALLEHLGAQAHTEGFRPARDLQYVGMAAQTTMYSSEFLKVSETVRAAVVDRYGESAADHFRELDTICSATQERQDAVSDLARRSDVVFVVGGYNSSNTTNLARVAGHNAPAYHIQGSGQLTAEAIRHQPYGKKAEAVTTGWLPEKPQVVIGMTSGASTPDSVLEAVLHEVLALGKAQP